MSEQLALLSARPRGSAVFSADFLYRYELRRFNLGGQGHRGSGIMAVIGINPSSATAEVDDPTIRKCMQFGVTLGYSELLMVNLFALRATDPQVLLDVVQEPVGPENDRHLVTATRAAAIVIAAWGVKRGLLGRMVDRRAREVVKLIDRPLHALRVSDDGHPWHPLFLPGSCRPVPFTMKEAP